MSDFLDEFDDASGDELFQNPSATTPVGKEA
jgi:hypothetical protein